MPGLLFCKDCNAWIISSIVIVKLLRIMLGEDKLSVTGVGEESVDEEEYSVSAAFASASTLSINCLELGQ